MTYIDIQKGVYKLFTAQGFSFNGISSATYGLIFANVGTIQFTELGGNIEREFLNNRISPKNIIVNQQYKEQISFDIDIVSLSNPIDDYHFITICNWLLNKSTYGRLTLEDVRYSGYHINCYFSNAQRIVKNGGIYGIKVTCNMDSGFMWANNNAKFSSTLSNFTFNNNSSQTNYIYPKVTLTTGNIGGTIKLANITDSTTRETIVYDTTPNEIITLTSNPYEIVASNHSGMYANFNKVFPRIVQGNNTLVRDGDIVKIEVEYEVARVVL